MLHPDKQAAFLPGILQIQWLEVISQTTLSVSNDSNQAEVSEFLIFVQRPLLALEDDGHVELLDDQVHHLPGAGVGRHRDLYTCALSKTWVVKSKRIISLPEVLVRVTCIIRGVHLKDVGFRTGPLSGVELVHDLVVVAVDAVHAGVVAPVSARWLRLPGPRHAPAVRHEARAHVSQVGQVTLILLVHHIELEQV